MFAFIYALFGAACACWLWNRAKQRGGRPAIVTWVIAIIWYIAFGMGLSFTIVNFVGKHSQAGWVGLVGTVIVAVALGFVMYRFSSSKISRRTA